MRKFISNLKYLVTQKTTYLPASMKRRMLNHVTFIGIAGSAAKTMTKDLTAAILTNFGPCQKTIGTFNTLKSVAGRVWHTNNKHLYCVLEVGVTGLGSLDLPVRLIKPDVAVVTVIGRDHYSAFKSVEAIAAEKEKVVLALSSQGIAVLNIDDQLVRSMGERCNRRVIWFGKKVGATLRLREARSCWPEPLVVVFDYQDKTYEVRTQLHGAHMAIPVLASLGVALAADLPLEKAILAIQQVQPTEGRMQVVTGNDGVVFIRDDIKAPQWSLHAPLEFLKEAKAIRKIAILGTVSDASGDATKRYKKYCRQFHEVVDIVVFVGANAHRALRARKNEDDTAIQGFSSIRDAATYLQAELRKGDLVLVKGSNATDHLVRLIINRSKPIQCWKNKCIMQTFCDKCPKLFRLYPDVPFVTKIDSDAGTTVPVFVWLKNFAARFLLSLKALLRKLG